MFVMLCKICFNSKMPSEVIKHLQCESLTYFFTRSHERIDCNKCNVEDDDFVFVNYLPIRSLHLDSLAPIHPISLAP
jgi:hypothetical protein